jgi:polyisoprenyl-phosphate glycosyltransferase
MRGLAYAENLNYLVPVQRDENSITNQVDHQKGGAGELVSVVVPLFNEAGNIELLVTRLSNVLAALPNPCEIILVDDGSHDGTWDVVARLTSKPLDEERGCRIIGCRLSRNFGHQAALLAGLDASSGAAIITMDGDLQHPPEYIPDFIHNWHAGFDIVNSRRLDSASASPFKRLTSRYFYQLFSSLAEVELSEGSSDFRLISRKVLREILRLRDSQLFLRGSVEWVGFRKTTIPYQVANRFSGQSKYTFLRMLRFAQSAIISHSTVPLRVGTWIGIITSLLAGLEIIFAVVMAYTGRTVPGWASILIIQSFFFGILFTVTGIIGTYLAAIYRMLQSRPNFIVAEVVDSASKSDNSRFSIDSNND